MNKAFNRVPVWVWLLLAAIFILSQVVPCLAFDRSEAFWTKQPCGFRVVEIDKGDMPKEVWNKAAQIVSQNRRIGTERIGNRVYSVCIRNDAMAKGFRVRFLKIHRGGEEIYSCREKVCE